MKITVECAYDKLVEPKNLTPHPRNPNTHPRRQIDLLAKIIEKQGFRNPIVVSEKSGFVTKGHARLKAALQLGADQVPVDFQKYKTEAAELADMVADNQIAELAETDSEKLDAIVADLKEQNFDLDLTGIDQEMLDEPKDGKSDPDSIPLVGSKAKARPGQVFVLGDHRLMCGDSAKAADVKTLLNGAEIHLVNMDPPYNVKYEPRGKKLAGKARGRPIMNDSMSEADFKKMLNAWMKNVSDVLLPGRAFYVWGGYKNCAAFPEALRANDLYFSQAIIWVKEHPVLSRSDFNGNHEWCFTGWREDENNVVLAPAGLVRNHRWAFYGWREGASHYFDPTTFDATDVWRVKKVTPATMVHLTEKPVELAQRAIHLSSRKGENVLDLFGGSGSTMIACEQMGRNNFSMELDPLYVDVIIERWEKFTGKKAVLDSPKTKRK